MAEGPRSGSGRPAVRPRRYRAVVVDDEPAARQAITTFLADTPGVEVVAEAGDGEEAVAAVRRTAPDLLFLDIQMPDLDGFGVLEALDDEVPPGLIIVTAYDHHALRAFEVHALDYVLKPFGRPRFLAAVERALHRLEARDALSLHRTLRSVLQGRRAGEASVAELLGRGPEEEATAGEVPPKRLAVRTGTRTVLVAVDTIDFVEADGDYSRLHVADRVHLVSERIGRLETLLRPAGFLRIHRSSLVRLDRVGELARDPDGGGTVVLDSGVRLRVARRRWEELEGALGLRG
ncbi:MAG: LytTR family DNA-binding domain-containing protein [Gemmatimonadota bacterium]